MSDKLSFEMTFIDSIHWTDISFPTEGMVGVGGKVEGISLDNLYTYVAKSTEC